MRRRRINLSVKLDKAAYRAIGDDVREKVWVSGGKSKKPQDDAS
jgi:hypothetical protein